MKRRSRLFGLVLTGALIGSGTIDAQRVRKRMGPVPIGGAAAWVNPDDYPPDALRLEREGRVVADLAIDSAGKVVSCAISQSSGTTSLDQKTCELALARGRFDPATDARGRPVMSIYKLPVRWVIPQGLTDEAGLRVVDVAQAGSAYEIKQIIGTDGKVEGCRMVSRSKDMADLCQQVPPGTQSKVRYTAAGEPIRATVHLRFSATVEPVRPTQ